MEANASAKILYKATSKARAARNAGQGQVDLAALTGAKDDAVLLVDGVATRMATGYADDRDILQLPTGPQYQAPWSELSDGTQQHTIHLNGSTASSTSPSISTRVVPSTTSGTDTVLERSPLPHPPIHNVSVDNGVDGSTPGTTSTPQAAIERSLPNQPPEATDRAYLRALYRQYGSKNQVLKIAWGGVVNLDGKTPKTWKWLQEALAEDKTSEGDKAQVEPNNNGSSLRSKVHLDLNTLEGRTTVDHLIAQGLLPRDEITEVVCYHEEGS